MEALPIVFFIFIGFVGGAKIGYEWRKLTEDTSYVFWSTHDDFDYADTFSVCFPGYELTVAKGCVAIVRVKNDIQEANSQKIKFAIKDVTKSKFLTTHDKNQVLMLITLVKEYSKHLIEFSKTKDKKIIQAIKYDLLVIKTKEKIRQTGIIIDLGGNAFPCVKQFIESILNEMDGILNEMEQNDPKVYTAREEIKECRATLDKLEIFKK